MHLYYSILQIYKTIFLLLIVTNGKIESIALCSKYGLLILTKLKPKLLSLVRFPLV